MSNNFTMRCVNLNDSNHHLYTVGKLYTVKEGLLICNNGSKIDSIKDYDDWTCKTSTSWELVSEDVETAENTKDEYAEVTNGAKIIFDILGVKPNERFKLIGRGTEELYYITNNLMVYRADSLCALSIRHFLTEAVKIAPNPTEHDIEYMRAVQVVFGKEYREYHRDINNILCVANMAHTQEFLLQPNELEFIKNGEMYVFEGE